MPGYGLVSSDGYELVDQATGLVLDSECAPECCGAAIDCCRDPERTRTCGLVGTAPDGRTSRRHATVTEFDTSSGIDNFESHVSTSRVSLSFTGALAEDHLLCASSTLPANYRNCEGYCRPEEVVNTRRLITRVGNARTERLNGLNCGSSPPGGSGASCEVRWNVPIVREDRTTEELDEDSVVQASSVSPVLPCSFENIRPPGQYNSASPVELCYQFLAQCWTLGSGVARSAAEAPAFNPDPFLFFPIPLGSSTITQTSDLGMPPGAIGFNREILTETVESTLSWVATETEWRQEYRATRRRTIVREADWRLTTTAVDLHIPSRGSGTITQHYVNRERLVLTETHRRAVVMKLGWDLDCDLSPGPTVCSPVVTDCQPDLIGYIIGERCGSPAGGSPATWVLPAANVQACGVVRLGGECWRFDPVNGRRTNDPTALGANIGVVLVTPESPRTCCECQPDTTCPKTELDFDDHPEWLGGYRELAEPGQVGRFIFTRPFVAGKCCCFAADRFRLQEQWSELETRTWPDNILQSRERITIIPVVRPPDLPPAPDISGQGGFRRDEPRVLFSIRIETFDGQGNPLHPPIDQHGLELIGPIGCPWDAFNDVGQVRTYTFDQPLHVDGLHPRNQRVPTPLETRFTDGIDQAGGTGWRIMRYSPGVICTLLTFDGEWERAGLPGDGIKFVVRSGVRWNMTPAEAVTGPCAGGCVESVLQPTPGDGPVGQPVLAGAGGGCSGCGGDGRLR
jgi:hypothetical protein